MAIQGLRSSDDFTSAQRPYNWREGILKLEPNGKAPLTGLTSQMSKKSTDDPRYYWFEEDFRTQRLALTANLTASNTEIDVASGARSLMSGHILYVEQTGERMLVNGDPASDTKVNVVRGFSNSTPTAVDFDGSGINPNLMVIGSAFEEGSDAPTGITTQPTEVYNYTQIFRNTLEATRTAMKTRLRTGDDWKEAQRECLQYHGIEMEKAFWFGKRNMTFRNGKPLTTTGGILSFIPSNNTTDQGAASTTDLQTLEEHLMSAFMWGSSEKMGWCGNRALLTIQQIARKNSNIDLVQGQKEFGMNISRLITPFGEVVLKSHPLFNLMEGGTTNGGDYTGINSDLIILDMANIRYRPLQDSDTSFSKELQNPGEDAKKAGYLTEAGLEVHHAETHYWIQSLNKAAADA